MIADQLELTAAGDGLCRARDAADLQVGAPREVEQAVAEARRQIPMLRQFVVAHDLVTIPGTDVGSANPSEELATGSLTFDGSGHLTSPGPTAPSVAISVTGQGDGMWLIDQAGEPVAPAWLWLDARSASWGLSSLWTQVAVLAVKQLIWKFKYKKFLR